jgi:Fic family protein
MLTKKLDYPVLFLSEYINKTRIEYYRLLNHTNQSNDYTEFILYILNAITEQAKVAQEKIVKIKKLMENTEAKIEKYTNLDYHKITRILFSSPFITVSQL